MPLNLHPSYVISASHICMVYVQTQLLEKIRGKD